MIGPEPLSLPAPSRTGPPGWKVLLALVCLVLSVVLWLDGLAGSLERPSVVDSLSLRQLELSALAAETLPPALRPALVGNDPRGELAAELQRQIDGASEPAPISERLELALLQRATGTAGAEPLKSLVTMVDEPRRALLQALIEDRPVDPVRQRSLLAPWGSPLMIEQLSCEQLGGPARNCPAVADRSGLMGRLIGVTVIPLLLTLAGTVLLLREGWVQWRDRAVPAVPLQGPPLSLVDVTLLIAGGFVLLGEVLVPLVAQPLLQTMLARLNLPEVLGQGVAVLGLYLILMAAPLLILWLMLRRQPRHAVGGWLQWYWHPIGSALRQSVKALLMVLPLVAVTGWLIERIWGSPGGSNPLLELVLTSADSRALLLLAFTAVVLAPLFEETLFRGVLLPVVGRRFGGRTAVVISAAVFALAHLSLVELAPLFVLGIALGWLRWRTGRLACSALLHSLWNGLTFANLLLLAG